MRLAALEEQLRAVSGDMSKVDLLVADLARVEGFRPPRQDWSRAVCNSKLDSDSDSCPLKRSERCRASVSHILTCLGGKESSHARSSTRDSEPNVKGTFSPTASETPRKCIGW